MQLNLQSGEKEEVTWFCRDFAEIAGRSSSLAFEFPWEQNEGDGCAALDGRRCLLLLCFFFFCLLPSLFPFFPLWDCVWEEKNFWFLLSNSTALDEDCDSKGPGPAGWLDPSFLWCLPLLPFSFVLFVLVFCLLFCFSLAFVQSPLVLFLRSLCTAFSSGPFFPLFCIFGLCFCTVFVWV